MLGAATGASEDHQFWTSFLRQLVKRGLKGVRLVISDAHEGLRQAIAKVLHEATWQRCRVHFMRNVLSVVPKQAQDAVAAIVRTIFAQPDHASAMTQLHEVARMLSPKAPQVAELLEDAARTSWPISTSRARTGDGCTRRTRSSACTRRSSVGPESSGSSHPGLTHADGRDASRRAGRQVAGLRPPLLQRWLDGQGGCLRGGEDSQGAARSDRVRSQVGGDQSPP